MAQQHQLPLHPKSTARVQGRAREKEQKEVRHRKESTETTAAVPRDNVRWPLEGQLRSALLSALPQQDARGQREMSLAERTGERATHLALRKEKRE